MPIEVRELVIKAVVEENTGHNTSSATTNNNGVTPAEEIIKTCVDKVLEILKEKAER